MSNGRCNEKSQTRLPCYSKVIPNLARLRRAVLRLKNNHQRIQSSGHGRGQLFYLFSNVFLLASKCLADLSWLIRLHNLKGFYQLREHAMLPFGSRGGPNLNIFHFYKVNSSLKVENSTEKLYGRGHIRIFSPGSATE